MKLFLDSANLTEIRDAAAMGLIDGVTTNPSLVAKEGRPFAQLIADICRIVDGPISAEVTAVDAEGIVREGRELVKIHHNVVVKVPLIPEGLKAVRQLSREGIKTNVTLCFSSTQALLAAKAGASFISPFVGRLDDISEQGMDVIKQIVTIYRNYGFSTQVLVASVRHPLHVVEGAMLGAHVATMPYAVLMQLAKHPLTDIGLKKFLADWEKLPKTV
ncbi:MAG: fructose-6-phosphate aldolase [Nitrospirae bacterium RIFCSPHIGHO2_01_FULL_66_17]|jgi:transaldolase|nr:MAG: fructose-6-phosphate aldolase [Nitrospirae bacterium RIFCSPHIGHO2_01_FULL_66_17]